LTHIDTKEIGVGHLFRKGGGYRPKEKERKDIFEENNARGVYVRLVTI